MNLEPVSNEPQRLDAMAGVLLTETKAQAEYCEGSVAIRQFRPTDAPALLAAIRESIKELSAWMSWCHAEYSIADASTFLSTCAVSWQRGERYSFVIIDRKDETLLGSVGLSCVNRGHQFANLGYWVRTSRTGQGVASAATLLAARFGLSELGLNRVELLVPVNNVPSQRVAEKVGAKQEGILRNRLLLQGKPHDAVLYSLVAADLATEKHFTRHRAARISVSRAK
jgi:ribosomal-protein-serine acetyltransferase